MLNGLEITKAAIDDLKEIQEYMALAKEENAVKTNVKWKKKYLALKAILNVAGVNLTDIDEIKEWLEGAECMPDIEKALHHTWVWAFYLVFNVARMYFRKAGILYC